MLKGRSLWLIAFVNLPLSFDQNLHLITHKYLESLLQQALQVHYLPQRKAKGRAKAKTLTGVEMVERKRKRLRNMASKDDGDACPSALNETQDCIQVIRSTAPV